MQFSADGRWLATEATGRVVRLWDLSAADPGAKPLELRDELQPYTIDFSSDGKWMVTGAWITPNSAKTEKDQSSVRLWNLKAPDIAKTRITLHSEEPLNAVALSPDGRRLATAGVDAAVRIWDLTSPDPSAKPLVLRGHHATVLRLVFGSDSRHIVSGGGDGAAIVWDIDAPDGAPEILHYGRNVTLLAVTPDGQKVITGDDHARPSLWNRQRSPPAQVVLDRVEDTIRQRGSREWADRALQRRVVDGCRKWQRRLLERDRSGTRGHGARDRLDHLADIHGVAGEVEDVGPRCL